MKCFAPKLKNFFLHKLSILFVGILVTVTSSISSKARAQGLVGGSVRDTVGNVTTFLSDTVVPLLLAIAFLVVVYNYVLFIWNADNEQDKAKMKTYTLWSLIAFFVILTLFGILQVFYGSLFGGGSIVIPQFPESA